MGKLKSTAILLGFSVSFSSINAMDFSQNDESQLSDFYGDDFFVSIATGVSQPINKAPAVASVITADEIVRTGATDLDQLLERIPGLHVARSIGFNPIYTFRGIHSNFNPQVLMLVNGIPLTHLYQGDRNLVWGGMPVEAISRVEVIRGPGSALYGADAFAGVINIILKQGSEITEASSGVRFGSFNSKSAWFVDGGTFRDADWSFSIQYSDTDGFEEEIDADGQSIIEQLLIPGFYGPEFSTNASLAPGEVNREMTNLDVRFGIDWNNLSLNLGLVDVESQNYAGIAEALDPNNTYGSTRWNFDFAYTVDDWVDDWAFKVNGSYYRTSQEVIDDLVLFPPGSTGPTPIPVNAVLDPFTPENFIPSEDNPLFTFADGLIGNPEVYEAHARFGVEAQFDGLQDHTVTLGAGYYYGDVYKTEETKNFVYLAGLLFPVSFTPGTLIDVSDDPSQVFLPEGHRDEYYALIQDVWRVANDWELTAGVRIDDYSDFGSTVNPRLALVWSASLNLTAKLLYGSAFRAPSFAETSVASNPLFLGNSALDPETMDSYELAFDYRPNADLEVALNFFYYSWDDIIQFLPDPNVPGGFRAQNAGEQTGYGSELEVVWRASESVDLRGNLAWQKSKDEDTDADAANAPEKQVYLQANWRPAEGWETSLQANWVLDRNRVIMDTRQEVDDYLTVDFTVRKSDLLEGVDVAIIVNNLFDESAEEPSRFSNGVAFIPGDLPLPGRAVMGELRFRF